MKRARPVGQVRRSETGEASVSSGEECETEVRPSEDDVRQVKQVMPGEQ